MKVVARRNVAPGLIKDQLSLVAGQRSGGDDFVSGCKSVEGRFVEALNESLTKNIVGGISPEVRGALANVVG